MVATTAEWPFAQYLFYLYYNILYTYILYKYKVTYPIPLSHAHDLACSKATPLKLHVNPLLISQNDSVMGFT